MLITFAGKVGESELYAIIDSDYFLPADHFG